MLNQPINEFQVLLKALSYFRTHWWLFLCEIVVIYGIALAQYFGTPSIFEAYASLLIDTSRRNLYQSVLLPGMNGGGSNARKQNMVNLLTSQEVAERFKNTLTDFFNNEGRPAHLRNFFRNGSFDANEIKNYVQLSWDRNSDTYNIRCTGEHPDAAHDFCLNYLNTIQSYYPEIGMREAMLKRDFLSRQIASLTRQVQEREQNLANFQKNNSDFLNYMLFNGEEKATQKARGDIKNLEQKMATNRAMKKLINDVPQAKRGEHSARSKAIEALTTQISELEYQEELIGQSNDPDREDKLRQIKLEFGRVSSQLARLNEEESRVIMQNPLPSSDVRKKLIELELDYQTDMIRLNSLHRELADNMAKEKQYQGEKMEYERLQADLAHRKKLLNNLYTKQQETELELSAGTAEIFPLQQPSRNPHRVAPLLPKYLYGALSIGIFILFCTVVGLLAFFPRLDSESEVNRLNLPVLGKVPILRKGMSVEEVAGFDFEYLKIMNYRILRETKDLKCPVIIVSSPHAREGKSTVTQLLTLASQSPGRKTLLIDGDLLTSHPNTFFGITEAHTRGVAAILESKDVPIMGGANSLIATTKHEGIMVMPRGGRLEPSVTPNYLEPVRKQLEIWRKEYDVIFIDTPPLFAANLAHQWAGIADLVILVARIYVTRPKDIVEALQTCKVFAKSPIGIALNCVTLSGPSRKVSNYYFSKRKARPTRLAA